MKTQRTGYAIALIATLSSLALPANADKYSTPKNSQYDEECGTCHMAFPAPLLDANSWRALMEGLPKHFGSDASLDAKQRVVIGSYLTANASSRSSEDATGKPQLRITETTRFVRKHHEVNPSVWKRPSVKSAANCAACHPRAAAGDFEEHDVRIPR